MSSLHEKIQKKIWQKSNKKILLCSVPTELLTFLQNPGQVYGCLTAASSIGW